MITSYEEIRRKMDHYSHIQLPGQSIFKLKILIYLKNIRVYFRSVCKYIYRFRTNKRFGRFETANCKFHSLLSIN